MKKRLRVLSIILLVIILCESIGINDVYAEELPYDETVQMPLKLTVEDEGKDVQIGGTIKLIATAEGGNGEYQYQFETSDGEILQPYSEKQEYSYCASEGKNAVIVNVKDDSGNIVSTEYVKDVESHQESSKGTATGTVETNPDGNSGGGNNRDIGNEDLTSPLEQKASVSVRMANKMAVKIVGSTTQKEYIHRDVVLSAETSGGSGELQYQYTEVYNGQSKVVQGYSTEKNYKFRTSGEGTHIYYVDVKDEQGQSVRAAYTIQVIMHPSGKLTGKLTSNKSAKEYIQRDVTLGAEISGGYGEVQYQYTEVYNGKSKVVQGYSTEKNYKFRTSGEGTHIYYVDIKDEEGQKLRLSYTMQVIMHPSGKLTGKLTSNKSAKEYIRRDVMLDAETGGGYGEVQCQYTEVYNGKSKVVQGYSTEKNYKFRTSGEGTHIYYVDIKDEEGQKLRLSYTMQVIMHPSGKLTGRLTSNKSAKEYIRRDVTLNAETGGGYGEVQYQYTEVYNGKSKVVQGYSTEKNYKFRTSGEGTHIYYVDIKDEEGQKLRLSYTMQVIMHPGSKLTGKLTSNKSAKEYIRRDVTLNAETSGGYGEVQYQYTEVYNGKSKVVQGYSTEKNYKFRTSGEGTHIYYVDIKDEEGQKLRLSYTMQVIMHPSGKLAGRLTSNKSAKEYIWRDIALNAETSGGYGEVQYQYTEVYDGKSKVVQEYSTEKTYKFRTLGDGKHIYYVDIKDEEGQKLRLSYTLQVIVHPNAIMNAKLSSNKSIREYIQRDVMLNVEATTGYGKLQYQYTEVYNGQTKIVQGYSEKNSYKFRTTGPGKHIYYVDVIDEGGQTKRLTYSMEVIVHPTMVLKGTFKSNVTGVAKENQSVKLMAASESGYGSKRLFQFREHYNGSYKVIQKYSEKKECSFNIKGAGIHTYYVDIQDEEGQILTLSLNISIGKNGWFYELGYKFYYKNGVKQLDLDGILPRQSSYYIEVNRTTCSVTVYAKDGNNGYIIPVKRFACSVGLPSTPTPTGTYYTPEKYRWRTLMGPSYGQYCTRIVGGVLFHSVAGYNMTSYNIRARDFNKLGQPASHGCVRLCVRDAKWIYDNCPLGTRVRIYDSSNPGPLGKPATIKIPDWQNWDPTDPNI